MRGRSEELWIETDDGEYLYGWYCRAENPVASALYFHGNTGNLTNTAFTIPHLLRSGSLYVQATKRPMLTAAAVATAGVLLGTALRNRQAF